jgi:hypothetical protein
MPHQTEDRNPFNPAYPDDVDYTRASAMFGFNVSELRSVEAADPKKIVTWSGQWDIRLNSGRQVYVSEWRQFAIYGGLLAGLPRGIAFYLWAANKEAKKVAGDGAIVMLEPTLRRVPARGEWADVLPPVCTIAHLNSNEARRGDEGCFSSMVAVWFQERVGLPCDEDVLNQLRALDWENRAMAWEP